MPMHTYAHTNTHTNMHTYTPAMASGFAMIGQDAAMAVALRTSSESTSGLDVMHHMWKCVRASSGFNPGEW